MLLLEADLAAQALQAADDALAAEIEKNPALLREARLTDALVALKCAKWSMRAMRAELARIEFARARPTGQL